MSSFDEIAGGVFEEEEFYNGVDEMMPDALDARQVASMGELFNFELFERVEGGEEVEEARDHSMGAGEGARFSVDDLF
jgi:hypothetical protein